MALSEVVKRAALKWVQATKDEQATEVTSFEQRTERVGNCDTCGYDQVVVEIWFKKEGFRSELATYSGNFTEFIDALDQYDI